MSSSELLRELLQERILVFDGAMGTAIQKKELTAEDFGGEHYEGCNEHLVLTRPDVIAEIHRCYLDAGADVIETDTFGSTPIVLAEYDLQDKAFEISRQAASLAKKITEEYSTPDKPRFVAGSMGPTTKSITVTGGVTFSQLIESFEIQARGLMEGGADLLIVETCQDTRNIKAALIAIQQASQALGRVAPVMVSGTIEPMGTMLAGQGVDALYASLEHAGLLSIGLNCATGPRFMTDHIRSLSELAQCYVSCIPNAGLPDEDGRYNESPDMITAILKHFVEEGWVNILGGCCGTTPEHIAAIAQLVQGKKPRRPQSTPRCHVSGIDYLEFSDEGRPYLVGERTNVIGSRIFKRLIAEERIEEASEIGRRQARSGAHVIDVCLADPDRDELADIETFLEHLIRKVKAPLMIDSTDPVVIERALQYCQGKSIINSINLEDGEKRFARVVPIGRKYGAAFIVGCIDDDPQQGMAVTVKRKLEVAARSFELLTGKYQVPPQDLIFDPLVFPCATGDENYIGSAEQTILGVTAIKERFPQCRTLLGISNVSFGLPPAGREVLNAVFLYHCTKAGLDLAIVNTEKIQRYASIPEEERHLAENLLFNRGSDPVGEFAAFYKEKKTQEVIVHRSDSLEERLAAAIVEASKEGLIEDLDLALQKYTPLEIINGPLLAGMDEVGRLFAANELIVAEVLQSAEVMKAAVAHLEPHMEKSDQASKGSMILATVKGDVHDIGKNLVEIILSNNGYRVINLGIKVPPEKLIEAVREHSPDMIGLSGLLVKSAQQMVATVQDLRDASITLPILVGGAALSNKFTRGRIAPQYQGLVAYAKDAMNGLEIANRIMNPTQRAQLESRLAEETLAIVSSGASQPSEAPEKKTTGAVIRRDQDIPSPPDYKPHILHSYPLEEIFAYINPQMLLGKHLGLKGSVRMLLEGGNEKALELNNAVHEFQNEILERKLLTPRAVFRFFPVRSDGDALVILDSSRKAELDRFLFPRQSDGDRLCLSDFVSPDREDNIALFVTTVADDRLVEYSERYKEEGAFLKSHLLQSIAIESAEAFAELLHEKIRTIWGIGDSPEMNLQQKFQAKYQGIRVSFGYPACPRLEDQVKLFHLLKAQEAIGVSLTEGFMMEPEASVSAMVFHHPDARYFSIADKDLTAFEQRLSAESITTG